MLIFYVFQTRDRERERVNKIMIFWQALDDKTFLHVHLDSQFKLHQLRELQLLE